MFLLMRGFEATHKTSHVMSKPEAVKTDPFHSLSLRWCRIKKKDSLFVSDNGNIKSSSQPNHCFACLLFIPFPFNLNINSLLAVIHLVCVKPKCQNRHDSSMKRI